MGRRELMILSGVLLTAVLGPNEEEIGALGCGAASTHHAGDGGAEQQDWT